jgi:hypothetical protein
MADKQSEITLSEDDASHRLIAESSTILRGLVGSSVHGLVLSGTDDRDEPRRYGVGFGKFEHWVYRSAAEREGHAGARSPAGDLDLTIYSLRKWARLGRVHAARAAAQWIMGFVATPTATGPKDG